MQMIVSPQCPQIPQSVITMQNPEEDNTDNGKESLETFQKPKFRGRGPIVDGRMAVGRVPGRATTEDVHRSPPIRRPRQSD